MREDLTHNEISKAVGEARDWYWERIKEKGKGSFSSIHEIRGVMDEEFCELQEAFHKKNHDEIAHELKDIIVAALFGLACLRAKKLEW